MKKIKNKKQAFKALGLLAFGVTPIVLSSCSSSSTLISRTVSKGNGSALSSNTTLSNFADNALNSDTGMKEYMQTIADDLILNWLYKLSQTSNVSFSNSYNNQRAQINEDYKDLVDSYKKTHGSSWALKFQQEVLDPVGGTEDAYKKDKWHSWATSQFETYLFNTDYLTYEDANSNIVDQSQLSSKTVSDLYTALQSQKFKFAVPTTNTNDYDKEYAQFMQYIWDQYVQIENPYVVDMSLWKYGTPTQGIDQYYTFAESTTTTENDSSDDSSSDSDSGSTTTANAGNYIYPYFGNDSSTSSTSATGTLTKFANFVNSANSATDTNVTLPSTGNGGSGGGSGTQVKIPFKSSYDTNGYGLLNIPNSYTDDSSTYILAKNTSIYSDLYIEFAAASSYLFWRNNGITDGNTNFEYSADATNSSTHYGIDSIDSNIQKAIGTINNSNLDPDTTTGLDLITKQFVSQTDIFSGSSGKNYELDLDSSYVNQIITKNGKLNGLRDNKLYVVDSFIPSDNNLTNFMLLRNSAGVHAITIDGYYFINGSSNQTSTLSVSEKKKRAGQVVLFRSLYNNLTNKSTNESDYSFAVDVQSELKTFYTNNLTWLIYNYAQTEGQNLFEMSSLTSLSDSEKTLATAINNYLHEVSYYTKVDDYNKALYNGKSTYSANYGIDVYKNGLAAPWTYESFTDADATKYDSNSVISFQVAATASIVKDPFATVANGQTAPTNNYDGSTYISNTSLKSSITTLTNTLTALSNVSFEGFRYSQYIYSNSYYVNTVLIAFGAEGSDLQNLVKLNYLKSYVSSYFDDSTLQFKSASVGSQDIKDYLNYGLSNFFFNSSFDSNTVKWLKFGVTESLAWNKVIEAQTGAVNNQKEELKNYKIKLWKQENQVLTSTAISNYLSLYTTVASVVYMIENNASYFLNYLSTQVTIGSTAYVAWQTSQNEVLEKQAGTDATQLLSASVLKRNVNNNFVSSYIGGENLYTTSGNLTITYETDLNKNNWTDVSSPNIGGKSSYQDSTTATNYYTVSSGMLGFLGLQTNSTNSMNSLITDRIFTNLSTDNPNGTGILYGYGDSYDSLISYVQNITNISSINTIANDLASKLKQSSLKQVADDKKLSLNQKKERIVTALTNLKYNSSTSISQVFQARNGIVNGTETSENNNKGFITDSANPTTQFSSYVIQINNSNLSSLDSFITVLKNNNGTTGSSGTPTQEQNAYDIFSNLVVQQAVNTTLQSTILNLIIASQGKINAYDVRLFTSLGPQWLENWKVTNGSSSSSSGDSSSG
ncbi:hypothetical protein D8X55_04795, partial [Malacoplasma penetrans]